MAWRLVLDVKKSGDNPQPGSDAYGERSLELHDRWVGYEEPGVRLKVIDLEKRLRIDLDHGEHTYSECSLFSQIAFRHFELRNRYGITSILMAGGGNTSDFSTVLHEHNLAMVDGSRQQGTQGTKGTPGWLRRLLRRWGPETQPRADILVKPDQDWLAVTTTSDAPLARFSANGTKCNSALLRGFVHFLRYFYPAHPFILDRIATGRYLPAQTRIQSMEGSAKPSDDITLAILAVEEIPDRAYSLDGYRSRVAAHHVLPVDASIERLMTQAIPQASDLTVLRASEVRNFRSAGKPLEAVLSYLELILETGSAPDSLTEAVRTDADSRVKRVVTAMQPGNEAEARSAIDTLLELRSGASHGGHILMIFEAGARAWIGQFNEAIELLVKAIELNPYLLGAYKDLGDQYARKYQFERAWRCWSAARKISPNHLVLESVDELEQTLLAQHPEYF